MSYRVLDKHSRNRYFEAIFRFESPSSTTVAQLDLTTVTRQHVALCRTSLSRSSIPIRFGIDESFSGGLAGPVGFARLPKEFVPSLFSLIVGSSLAYPPGLASKFKARTHNRIFELGLESLSGYHRLATTVYRLNAQLLASRRPLKISFAAGSIVRCSLDVWEWCLDRRF